MQLGGGATVPEKYKQRGTKWDSDFSQADVRRQAPDYVSGFMQEVLQEGGETPITADLLKKDDGDVQKELQRILAGTNITVDTKGLGENAIVLNRQGGSKAEEVVIDTGSSAYRGAFTVGGTDTGTEENLQKLLSAISSLLDEASAESQYKKRVGKPMTGALSRASAKASRQAGTTPSASGTPAGNNIFKTP
jgi:ribosomal protein L12E/L44/L45/RPP1/RPP2